MYKVSPNGLALIEQFEECVLHVYKDSAGVPTIGFGSTRYTDGTPVRMGDPDITRERALELLEHYINTLVIPVINSYVRVPLNQNQIDSTSSLIYNIGSGGFEKSTLLKRINQSVNPTDPSVEHAWIEWDLIRKNGKLVVSKGLLKRRQAEYKLFIS